MTVNFQKGPESLNRDFEPGTTVREALAVAGPALNAGACTAVSNGVTLNMDDTIDGLTHIQLHSQSHSKAA